MDQNDRPKSYGERLRRARLAVGMTQAELAKRAGYSHQSGIGNIEAGKRDGAGKTATLAKVLQIDPYWLETGEGDMQFTLSGDALQIARAFSKMPEARQEELREIIMKAIGPYVPSEVVETRMPITRPVGAGGRRRK